MVFSPSHTQDIQKQRATASALLLAAGEVGGEERPVSFSWEVERIPAGMPGCRFALHIVPERDCHGFLFRAPPGGKAQLLCVWEGRENTTARLPASGELIWDGEDNSYLVIVTAGAMRAIQPAGQSDPRREDVMQIGASPWRGREGFQTSDAPIALDSVALGLGEPSSAPS